MSVVGPPAWPSERHKAGRAMGRCLESRPQPSLSSVLLFLIGPLPDDVPRDEHNDRLNKNTPPDWVLPGDRPSRSSIRPTLWRCPHATEMGVLLFQYASLYLDGAQPPPPPIAFLNISAKKPPSAPAGIAAAKDKAINHSGSVASL